MPYRKEEVERERVAGAGLERFDRWVRVDNAGYRTSPPEAEILRTLHELECFEENRRDRLGGARKLLALGLTPKEIPLPQDGALFKVPLFVRDRERVLLEFAKRGVMLDYIYDPPLDRYAERDLAERLPSPEAAVRWSRDVLPVNPLLADRFLAILRRAPRLIPMENVSAS